MHIETVYRQGSGASNEDFCVVNENTSVFAVIDGATGLTDDTRASGKIASSIVGKSIQEWDGTGSLVDVLRAANHQLGLTQGTADGKPKETRSSCCLAAVQIVPPTDKHTPANFNYIQLGDCMIFIEYDDGTVRSMSHDFISVFDDQVLVRFEDAWIRQADGQDPNQWDETRRVDMVRSLRQALTPQLIQNRRRLNTIGGYGALDGSQEALPFLESGRVSLNRVKSILLTSDGLKLPCTDPRQSTWMETAQLAMSQGLLALEEEVLRREASDPACFTYPRLKPADDKTGILIRL